MHRRLAGGGAAAAAAAAARLPAARGLDGVLLGGAAPGRGGARGGPPRHAVGMQRAVAPVDEAELVEALGEFRGATQTANTIERYRTSLKDYAIALADDDDCPLIVDQDGNFRLTLEGHLTSRAARRFLVKCCEEKPSASFINGALNALKWYARKFHPDSTDRLRWLWTGGVPDEWTGVRIRAKAEKWCAGPSVAPLVSERLVQLYSLCSGLPQLRSGGAGPVFVVYVAPDGSSVRARAAGISAGEVGRLLSAAPGGDWTFYPWLCCAAQALLARHGEVCRMSFNDVEVDGRTGRVSVYFREAKTLSAEQRAEGRRQRVDLPEVLAHVDGRAVGWAGAGKGMNALVFFGALTEAALAWHGLGGLPLGRKREGIPAGTSLADCLGWERGFVAVLDELRGMPDGGDRPIFGGFYREEFGRILIAAAAETFNWPASDAAGNVRYRYNFHSVRHGAASELRLVLGVPLHVLRQLGRWHSAAYQIYLDPAHPDIDWLRTATPPPEPPPAPRGAAGEPAWKSLAELCPRKCAATAGGVAAGGAELEPPPRAPAGREYTCIQGGRGGAKPEAAEPGPAKRAEQAGVVQKSDGDLEGSQGERVANPRARGLLAACLRDATAPARGADPGGPGR
eukprot:gene5505-23001_t